jgi:hypothetical protein
MQPNESWMTPHQPSQEKNFLINLDPESTDGKRKAAQPLQIATVEVSEIPV